jgi:mRNA interferase MazF
MGQYQKDFESWAQFKTRLQHGTEVAFFREREIWWVAIGHNIGSEEDGKGFDYARPVLVLRKFNRRLFWGIPMTTTVRSGKYYVHFSYKPLIISAAILSQLRAFDAKRLLFQDGIIDGLDFARIQLGLVEIIRGEPQK